MSKAQPVVDYKKQIGDRIKHQRNYLRMSRVELADKIPITVGHLTKIENGHIGMSLEVLTAISNQINLSTDYILKGDLRYEFADNRSGVILENISRQLNGRPPGQLERIEQMLQSFLAALDDKDE